MMLCSSLVASAATVNTVGVRYDTYVQQFGWLPFVNDGQVSGTTGHSLRIEAFRLNLTNANSIATATSAVAKITYESYIQGLGWQFPESNGGISGTRGSGKRIEAFRITLTDMSGYEVEYRTFIQRVGWQAWKVTKDGTSLDHAALAGTTGRSLRVEAIQVKLKQITTESIANIEPVSVSTTVGTAPTLPSTATAVLSDGTTESMPVAWASVTPSEYASVGSFTVNGTVSGSSIQAVATVTVTE